MKSRLLALFVVLAAAVGYTPLSLAQATIPVSGQHVVDNTNFPFSGILRFTVTNASDVPVTYTPQGGSPTTATIDIPVSGGIVQTVSGFAPQIPNPATMSPANTRYRVQALNFDSFILYTLPLTSASSPGWSFDGYVVPSVVTATGQGRPQLPCQPGAQYTQLDRTQPYNWVCSQLRSSSVVAWTLNPSTSDYSCQKGGQAFVSPAYIALTSGSAGTLSLTAIQAPYCVDSTEAYATPGMVVGIAGSTPGPFTTVSTNAGILAPVAPQPSRFLTGVDNGGNFTRSQPTFADVSGSLSSTQLPSFSGDVTSSAGSNVLGLITVNSNVGTCGDSTHIARVTLDAQGRTTSCTPVAIAGSTPVNPAGPTAHQWLSAYGSGTFTLAQPGFSDLAGAPTGSQIAGAGTLSNSTTGNAATATQLAASPTQCPLGQVATGISANGTPNCTSASANVFPGTHGIVYNTGTNTSMNATSGQVVGLWSSSGPAPCTGTNVLQANGQCGTPGSGGGGSPGGSSYAIQYNNSGAFGGAAVTGIGKFSTSAAPTAAVASDVVGLWTGTCDSSHVLAGDGSCVTNAGSALSGQTVGRLPLASSATASTSSSSFFQSLTTAGVFNNGFQSITTSGIYCQNRGAAFTLYGCHETDVYDDGTAGGGTAASLTGTNFQAQAWGAAGGGAGAIREGRTSTNINEFANGAMVHAGTKIAHVIAANMFGGGDAQGLQLTMGFHAGCMYDSDQCSQMAYFWASEQGHWSATVATGGTNTSPKVTGGGGCNTPQNQACAPSPGWVMLDTSVVRATGKITSACTTSSIPWMSSCATDQTTIPASSAWGTALNVNLTSTNTWDTTTAQTFTIGAGGGTGAGTFAAGDHACVIGNQFFENRIITSVAGTAGAQTITLPLSRPEVSLAIFKGDCMHYVGDQNSAHNLRLALPSVSIDGAHLLTSFPQFSAMIPYTGSRGWTTYDGGVNSGFHLYAGARITRVDTSRPDFVPFDDAVISISLEPNSAFSVGDSIESPDFPAQKLDGQVLVALQDTPSTDQAYLTGMHINIGGHGSNDLASVLAVANTEPTSSYTPWGGPLDEPSFITEENIGHGFGNLYLGQYTPLHAAFTFNNHQPGQTGYTFIRDPTWGQFDIHNDGWHLNNVAALWQDQGFIYAAGALFTGYGMRTAAGDGGGNGAGLDFSNSGRKGGTLDTWLAQCDLTSDGSKTDLCVTSQGSSRTANNVTADRGLQVGNMQINGALRDGAVVSIGDTPGGSTPNGFTIAKAWTGSAGFLESLGFNLDDTGSYELGGLVATTQAYPGIGLFRPATLAFQGEGTGGMSFVTRADTHTLTQPGDIDFSSNGYGPTHPNLHFPGGTSNSVFGGAVSILGVADGCANFTSGVLGSTGTACGSGGGGGTPGGISGQLQYNNAGAFGGASNTALTSTGDLTVNSLTTNNGVQIGTSTPNGYITTPSAGTFNMGGTSGAADAVVKAQSFFAQGGIVDGRSVVTTATTTTLNVDAVYGEEFLFYNGTASSGTITFNLPTSPAAGQKRCMRVLNSAVAMKVQANTGQVIWTDAGPTATSGYVDNTTGLNNGACVVAVDSSTWVFSGWGGTGSWTGH